MQPRILPQLRHLTAEGFFIIAVFPFGRDWIVLYVPDEETDTPAEMRVGRHPADDSAAIAPFLHRFGE